MPEMSTQEALIQLMVVVSASDREMTDGELNAIGTAVRALPVFRGFEEERILSVARACQRQLQAEGGLDSVLNAIGRALPTRLHDTAYALAIDVVASDMLERLEELRVLQLLRQRLDLDDAVAGAIQRAALARHRRLE